jgi:hypothetical protein
MILIQSSEGTRKAISTGFENKAVNREAKKDVNGKYNKSTLCDRGLT